jgi:hypothetical protein
MYKRAFLFGCSFTRYIWPTWADMLTYYNPDIDVFNFARSGMGNVGISYRIMEADVQFNFNVEDLIIVMWTHWNRKDLFSKGEWITEGNIFNSDYYGKEYIKKYWTMEHSVIENLGSIILANKSYNINDQYSLLHLEDYRNMKQKQFKQSEFMDFKRPDGFRISTYSFFYNRYHPNVKVLDFFKKIPTIKDFDNNNNSQFSGYSLDDHPDIECHISFYNNHIAKKNNLITIPETNIYSNHQKEIVKILEKVKGNNLNIQSEKIQSYFNPLRLSTNLFGQRY